MSIPGLSLRRIEASLGLLGPRRESAEYRPLDEICFRFSAHGVRVDDAGIANLTVETVMVDESDRRVFQHVEEILGPLALGGNTLQASTQVDLGVNVPIGTYRILVLVTDRVAGSEVGFERSVQIGPTIFQLVAPRCTYDEAGMIPAPYGGTVGQSLIFRWKLVGFARTGGRISSSVTVSLLDSDGRPVSTHPLRSLLQTDDPEIAGTAESLDFQALLNLNREGEFTLQAVVHDEIAETDTTFEAPICVPGAD